MSVLLWALVAGAAPVPIAGRWVTGDGAALVEVAPCGGTLCGRVVRVLKPDPTKPTRDVNNPDPALRGRPILGLPILSSFTAGEGEWDGRIYDPRNGRTYRSVVTREGATLRVKGCWGPFCRTQLWRREG